MRSPLNGSLEIGVRVLMVLSEAFPAPLDLNQLVLLDHGLLHSADLGGPESIHPALPIRAGELGVKRQSIAQGLEVMIRAGLVEMQAGDAGIEFSASESAHGFLNVLTSNYAILVHSRANWVIETFGELDETSLRGRMRRIFVAWSEEFEHPDIPAPDSEA